MEFPIVAPLIQTAGLQHHTLRHPGRIRCFMPDQRFARNGGNVDPLDPRRCPGEIFVHHRLVQPHRFKYLGATIALDGRYAHLRDRLHHALDCCLDVVFDGLLMRDVFEHPFMDHVVQRFKRQVGIDRSGTVANKEGKMMDFARLARLKHQPHTRPASIADKMMVHARHRKQRRDRRLFRAHAAIGQDQDVHTLCNRLVGLFV